MTTRSTRCGCHSRQEAEIPEDVQQQHDKHNWEESCLWCNKDWKKTVKDRKQDL